MGLAPTRASSPGLPLWATGYLFGVLSLGSGIMGALGKFLTPQPLSHLARWSEIRPLEIYTLAPMQILLGGRNTSFIIHLHLSANVFIRVFAKGLFLDGRRWKELRTEKWLRMKRKFPKPQKDKKKKKWRERGCTRDKQTWPFPRSSCKKLTQTHWDQIERRRMQGSYLSAGKLRTVLLCRKVGIGPWPWFACSACLLPEGHSHQGQLHFEECTCTAQTKEEEAHTCLTNHRKCLFLL